MTRTLLLALLLATPALAQDPRVERVEIDPMAVTTTIRGSLRADELVDYLVPAEAGQTMTVTLRANNSSAQFNVIAPGATIPRFNGATSGRRFQGPVVVDGDQVVRLFQTRSAVRRDDTASYALEIGVRGAAATRAAGPAPAAPPPLPLDYADSLRGVPDWWEVTGVGNGRSVNLRADPSLRGPVLARLPAGTMLRNHGCRINNGARWCEVDGPNTGDRRGWVNGQFLREATRQPG